MSGRYSHPDTLVTLAVKFYELALEFDPAIEICQGKHLKTEEKNLKIIH